MHTRIPRALAVGVCQDKALRILGMKTNRQKLNELCKANGIKNVRFNNAYIGFPRKEIEALAARLRREKGG